MEKNGLTVIRPQPGPQTQFLQAWVDVGIYGGAAGGGKTYALLLDPLRYIAHPYFRGVILRMKSTDITRQGGLWEEGNKLYLPIRGTKADKKYLKFTFKSGSTIQFGHFLYEKEFVSWQGTNLSYVAFDELTHFTETKFWYMFSRLRNVSGIPALIRATCNPDPDHFCANLLEWYIDQQTGYVIKSRAGVVRYFRRRADQDSLEWYDSKKPMTPQKKIKEQWFSFTFIPSKLEDNKILLEADPGYKDRLALMPLVEREQLLYGNWKIKPAPGLYFKKTYFELVEPYSLPEMVKVARGWDLAASTKDSDRPDWTAGVKIGKGSDGKYYVLDLIYVQYAPSGVEAVLKHCASVDGQNCFIRIPQDPGQAGKFQIQYLMTLLSGYPLRTRSTRGDKVMRAGSFSAACANGQVRVVRADWNDIFFRQLEQFPPTKGSPDIVDACVEAFFEVTLNNSKITSIVKPIIINKNEEILLDVWDS